MDRKTFKQMQQDRIDCVLNGQDMAEMMAQLEIETMELAAKIDKCKDKKRKAKLSAKLDKMMKLATTISAGNVSLLNH